MDVWKTCRGPALTVLGGVGVFVASTSVLHGEPLTVTAAPRPTWTLPDDPALPPRALDLRQTARALGGYVQDVCAELSTQLAVASLTMIGGHAVPPPPPPQGPPAPPPINNMSPPPPPPAPPPTPQGGPPPTPPPPTTQGGPPPSTAPEPASIVTGLLGLSIAGAAGWYKRRKN